MKWLDGHKSIISSVILLIVNSDYVAGLITDPNLYSLIQGIVALALAGSLAHHIKKAVTKKPDEETN